MMGLALAFLVPIVVSAATLPTQSSGTDTSGGGSYTLQLENPLKTEDLGEFIKAIGTWLVAFAIPIAVGLIIYAGILLVFSRGESARVKRAGSILLYVFIGLLVMFIGGGFIALIESILNLGQ